MSTIEENRIAKTLGALKSLAGGSTITVICIAFGAGAWMTSLKSDTREIKADLDHIRKQQDQMADATQARLADWTAWRHLIDETRYTRDDHDLAATIFNMRPAPATMPYYFEIKRKQP